MIVFRWLFSHQQTPLSLVRYSFEYAIFYGVARWVAFICVGVDKCQSEDSFVCFGAKPTQRAFAREISHETGRE